MIILREGTDTSQGKAQLISNINACCVVVDAVRTTLARLPCSLSSRVSPPALLAAHAQPARGRWAWTS